MTVSKSVYSLIGDLYEGYGEAAKKAGCGIVGAATKNPAVIPECLKAADKVEDVIEDAIDIWNQVIGKESSATLGTRILRPNTVYKGNLVLERQFLTPAPFHKNNGIVRIEEIKGKAKATIEIYLIDPTSKQDTLIGKYILNEDKKEKKDIGQLIRKEFSDAMGKFILVHLKSPIGTNRFKYSIELS